MQRDVETGSVLQTNIVAVYRHIPSELVLGQKLDQDVSKGSVSIVSILFCFYSFKEASFKNDEYVMKCDLDE